MRPAETIATGRFTAALPDLVAMFARHYGTEIEHQRIENPSRRHAVSATVDQIADRIYLGLPRSRAGSRCAGRRES